jgi:phosphatidylglycerophosphate synthase
MMNPRKVKKIAVLIPTLLLAVLLVQHNYSWIFGIMIGTAIALSSCELIQKAVNNSFVRKSGRKVTFFLFGFVFRFIFFAALLYAAIVYFKINVLAIAISFTIVQFAYPFYLLKSLENREKHV